MLYSIFNVFRECLYGDLDPRDFCDSFAQTLTYSIFLAKLKCKDPTAKLTLYNVYENIPRNFPLIRELSDFLKKLEDSDSFTDIEWVVNEILSNINNINTDTILKDLSYKSKDGSITTQDPYIHFYETFLAKYDKNLRDVRGVYYTPEHVVDFIINSLDLVLDIHLNKKLGHRDVNLLDFATGTGAFLIKAVQKVLSHIDRHSTKLEQTKENILNNFYGFEYLIAPYTLAHLKISELLRDSNIELQSNERLKVYLTNTLQSVDLHMESRLLFYKTLGHEAQEAQGIKNRPVIAIVGNPPYNTFSTIERAS